MRRITIRNRVSLEEEEKRAVEAAAVATVETPEVPAEEPAPAEVPAEEPAVDEADVEIVETLDEDADLSSEIDDVAEGSSILTSTEEMEEDITESVETGEGLTERESRITTSALEHFYTRLDFNYAQLSKTSLESFTVGKRLATTKAVLEELASFNKRLSGGLNIAQEGIGSRFLNTMKLAFTSKEKIHTKLNDAAKAIAEHGNKAEVIKEPGWGRSFAISGKSTLTGADVISYVTKYQKAMSSPELNGIFEEYVKLLNKLSTSVSKSSFIAKDEATKEIIALIDKLEAFNSKTTEFNAKHDLKTAENDPSYEPLDVASAKKLADVAVKLFDDNRFTSMLSEVQGAVNLVNTTIFNESGLRLAGQYAADIKATMRFVEQLNPIMDEIGTAVYERNRSCFAVANYIKASTK